MTSTTVRLDGAVVIVSGAARGLGAAFAQALRGAGAIVVGFDIAPGADLVADASDPAQVRDVVESVVSAHGRVDVSVANAGRVRWTSPLDEWERGLADFDDLIATNLRGPFLLGRAVAPFMVGQGSGHIVNISTDHLHRAPGVPVGGGAHLDVYDASKYGVTGLTDAWAVALSPHGIRVNELCMGAVRGDLLVEMVGEQTSSRLGPTWLDPHEIAHLLVELIAEGPDGRTGSRIGIWVGHPVALR